MHAGQNCSHTRAFCCCDVDNTFSGQTIGDGKGLILDQGKKFSLMVSHGRSHRQSLLAEMCAQLQIKGKLLL